MQKTDHTYCLERRISVSMGFLAGTLALMASLHIAGILGGGSKPFRATDAGVAEAITGLVLAGGSVALMRGFTCGRGIALAATGFAIVSFVVGLSFTVRGGGAIDLAYHATVLPLLLLTLVGLRRITEVT